MPDKSVFSPADIAASLLGGLAGAVVYAVLSRGPELGPMLLAQLSPLPVMIIALGLGAIHGATAALVGTIAITAALGPLYGMGYGLLVALPAFVGCYAAAGAPVGRRDLITRNFSGAAVTAIAAALAAAFIFFAGLSYFSRGGVDEPISFAQGAFFLVFESSLKEQGLDAEAARTAAKQFVAYAAPALMVGGAVLLHAMNLWIAARLTQISGMLKRPWPDIASDFVLPRGVGVVFVLALPATLLGGPAAQVAFIIAAASGVALALQGLAAAHFWLRGSRSGVVTLAILYCVTGVLLAPLALFAILGLLDMGLRFRDRKTAGGDERVRPGSQTET